MTASSYEENLNRQNILLPDPAKPVGAYRPVVCAGNIAYLSGQISKGTDGKLIQGKAGKELSLESAQVAARAAALNVISLIKNEIGFDRFERVLRLVGYVQCEASFSDIHLVMNGASEVFEQVFGEQGIHARSAVGMISLPLDSAVEIEATIQLKDLIL